MKNPELLGYFVECYYNQSVDNIELDDVVEDFKYSESSFVVKQLVSECCDIIKQGVGDEIVLFIRQNGRRMRSHKAELFIKFLYNRLTDTPTEMTPLILQRIE